MPTYYIKENLHYHDCPCGWSVQCVDKRRMKLSVKLHDKNCPEKNKLILDYSTNGKIPPHSHLSGIGLKEILASEEKKKQLK